MAVVAGPQLQPSISDAVASLAAGGPKTGLEASLALVVNKWQQISKSKKRAMVQANAAWLRTMQTAVNKTMIISEILDPRTRALIQVNPLGPLVWTMCCGHLPHVSDLLSTYQQPKVPIIQSQA